MVDFLNHLQKALNCIDIWAETGVLELKGLSFLAKLSLLPSTFWSWALVLSGSRTLYLGTHVCVRRETLFISMSCKAITSGWSTMPHTI